MTSMDARLIRRYKSRKFYDTEAHEYITSAQLLTLYRAQPDQLTVTCSLGDDVTNSSIAAALGDVAKDDGALASKVTGLIKEGRL